PPFNLKDWRAENELTDDPRWAGYEVPPKSNANYAWILNMISKLSQNGVAGFILANGALSGGGEEYKIRKQIIENDLVEAILILPGSMFYSTDISVSMWIINRNKKERTVELNDVVKNYRERTNEVLFFDLRKQGVPFEKKYIEFDEKCIANIARQYHNWQQTDWKTTYQDIEEFCKSVTIEEIQKKDYSLVPSKYIEFKNIEDDFDFDEQMNEIKADLKTLFSEETKLKQDVLEVFKSLGYEL